MERVNFKSSGIQHLFILLLSLMVLSTASCKKSEEYIADNTEDPIEDETLPDTLKVISYNILEGMKNDRSNNYNKFVEWVQSQQPDVLALQEVNGFNQRALEKLAARYGHRYVITNLKSTDNYPVAVTSKYPLESRRKITLNVSHGAIFCTLRDADINFVITHFWPQAYWKTVGDNRGNEYRLQETNVNLDSTIRKFPTEQNWLYMGDFNAVSSKDFDPTITTTNNYWVTDAIEAAGFMDVIHYKHGYKSNGSAVYDFSYPGRRIDFIFATPAVQRWITKAMPIYDDFTKVYSDHPPIMVHLLLKK